jgi:hypothetical protein
VGEAGEAWGEVNDSRLAHAQEANRYRRFERQFQLLVLILLSVTSIIFVLIDSYTGKSFTKDVLILLLPLFSFVLGKLDNAEGR